MAATVPLGVLTRPRRDWIIRRTAGGSGAVGNIALKYGYVGLYNNATDGSYIGIYGLTTTPAYLFSVAGNPIAAAVSGRPAKFDEGTWWGLTGTANSATAFGNLLFLFGQGNTSAVYLSDTPLLILPAGWSLLVRSINVALGMSAQFLWGPWP